MVFCDAKFKSDARLDGKTVIVTGCNTGIGKSTVQDIYKRGARVIMACRSVEKAEAAAEDIKKECADLDEKTLGTIVLVELNLSSLKSVRNCAQKILEHEEHIDILINNAGLFCPDPESRTEEGFEMQFGTNHLGHFLFTLLLLPRIIKSAPSRIVNVASIGHTYLSGPFPLDDLNWQTRTYSPTQAYFQSKLANVLFTKELANKLEEAGIQGVTVYSLHPGNIATDIGRHVGDTFCPAAEWFAKNIVKPFFKSPEQGAQTTLYCAIDEKAGKETGLYYDGCKVKEPSSEARSVENAKKLWELSIEMVGLDKNYNMIM